MIFLATLLTSFSSSVDTPAQPQENTQIKVPSSDSSLRTPNKGARVYLIGEFLYWSANEDGLNFAYKAKGQPGQLPLLDVKIKPFDIEWKPGFRVGLGYRLPHDRWEAKGYVTQFRTTNYLKQTASGKEFIEPNFGQLSGSTMSFIREEGNWHLKYTLFDIELARSFAASKALAICPFFGARAAWIHQRAHTEFSGSQALEVEAKNHYRAGGLRLGSDLNFYLMDYVCFFGQASASLLSGHFEDETQIELNQDILFSGKTRLQRLLANCELRAGAKGTIPLYRKEAFLTFGLTYDMSLWFSENQTLNLLSAPDTIQVQEQMANLTLQGVTFTTRLDF